jgi:hypothetical protein
MHRSPICLTIAAILIGSTATSARAENAPFGCDARAPDICVFSICYDNNNSRRNFTMKAGERDQISGVVPGKDTYCVAINNAAPGCRCRVINGHYNN